MLCFRARSWLELMAQVEKERGKDAAADMSAAWRFGRGSKYGSRGGPRFGL